MRREEVTAPSWYEKHTLRCVFGGGDDDALVVRIVRN